MCSNVCMHVNAHKSIHAHVFACVQRLQFDVRDVFQPFSSFFLSEVGISIRPKLTDRPSLTSQLTPEIPFQGWCVREASKDVVSGESPCRPICIVVITRGIFGLQQQQSGKHTLHMN